jgi:hypothetical protein
MEGDTEEVENYYRIQNEKKTTKSYNFQNFRKLSSQRSNWG